MADQQSSPPAQSSQAQSSPAQSAQASRTGPTSGAPSGRLETIRAGYRPECAVITLGARRIEAKILGHPLPSSGTSPTLPAPSPRREPAPAPRGSGRSSTGPRSRREDSPVADVVEDLARTAATAFGRSVVRSVFCTKRRGRRRGGLFG